MPQAHDYPSDRPLDNRHPGDRHPDDRSARPSRFRAAHSFLQALAIPAFIALMIGLVFAGEYVLSALLAALSR